MKLSELDLQDVVLVHEQNRLFLRGIVKEIATKDEVIRHISRVMKLPSVMTTSTKWITFIFSLISGIIVFSTSLFSLMFLGIGLIGNGYILQPPSLWAFMVLCVMPPLGLGTLVGYRMLKTAYLLTQPYTQYAERYYYDLISSGIVVIGEVKAVRQFAQGARINYRFDSPSNELKEKRYDVVVDNEMHIGDKVAVLYLNDNLQVLL